MTSLNIPTQSNHRPRKYIGEILQDAGLISSPQLRTALILQSQFSDCKLGEILVAQGWLKAQTVKFLVDVFSLSQLSNYLSQQPIGYYLKEAGLLTNQQIDAIVQEQRKQGCKFCYLAVLEGYLRPKTADFFLNLVAEKFSLGTQKQSSTEMEKTDFSVEAMIAHKNLYEEITSDTISNLNVNESSSQDIAHLDDREIVSSPMSIDL